MLDAAAVVHVAAAGVSDIEDEFVTVRQPPRRNGDQRRAVAEPQGLAIAHDPERVTPQLVAVQARESVELGD